MADTPESELGGPVEVTIDLTQAGPVPYVFDSYGIYFAPQGNPGAILDLDLGNGKRYRNVIQGTLIMARSKRLTYRRATGSVATGSVRLHYFTEPGTLLASLASANAESSTLTSPVAPSGGATQAHNAAVGTNAPVLATDGISANGLQGVKIFVSTPAAQTLSAAGATTEIRYWWYDGAVARWRLSEEGMTPARSGVRDWASGDIPIIVPAGADRFYAEVVGWDTSGAGELTVGLCGRYSQ